MTHLPHERASPPSGTPPPATTLLALPEAQQGSGEASQQLMDGKEDFPGSLEAWQPGGLEAWAPALDLLLFSCLNLERSLHRWLQFPRL